MADEKIIFSMNGVGKILPHNNRVILKDIYLSFFYGAKIGIVGLNGSGKSTLMKIIAGIEKGYQGEVVWAPGYSVGYLEQEPQMDPDKTVIEVVQEGVQEVMDILKEYEEVNMKFCEPMSHTASPLTGTPTVCFVPMKTATKLTETKSLPCVQNISKINVHSMQIP